MDTDVDRKGMGIYLFHGERGTCLESHIESSDKYSDTNNLRSKDLKVG